MNLLYLCADPGIPIRGHKGASVHVRQLTNALARAGHDVTLLSPAPGPETGPAPAARLVPVALRENGASPDSARHRAAVSLLLAAARAEMRRQPFDAIYERYALWSDAGARLAAETGLPLVLEVNAPLRLEAARYRQLDDDAAAATIERAQFGAAHALAAVSAALANYVIRRGAPAERVHVLPNAVDPVHFHPGVRGGSVRHRHGLHGRRIVGFVGRARPWHDLETLLAAVGRLRTADPRIHLLLVGQMPGDLPDRLAAHGLLGAATLTGPVPHEQVPEHIAAMDVAVSCHQALDDFYFSPLKLFEYLACGVPTVAADIGQPARLIRPGETGLLYPPGDPAALAAAIASLIAAPAEARRLAWNGAAHVLQEHTWDGNARAVLGWLGRPAAAPTAELPLLDPRLRQRLYRATRPDLARPLLARATPMFARRGPERLKAVADIGVLKYKPGRRCVLGYTLIGRHRRTGAASVHRVVGKVFRDERGERLHRLQQSLWDGGFGPQAPDGIHVPRSLGYAPKMRMHLQERAPGYTLNELVVQGPIAAYGPRAAQALAKLHAFAVPEAIAPDLGRYTLADELANLETFASHLRAWRPADAPTIDRLHQALRGWGAELSAVAAPAPIHRDFYYSQLLFAGNRVTLIDFDLFAWGDPAIDAANFITHLRFMGLDLLDDWDALAADAAGFADAYARHRPTDAAFWARCAFYEASTIFRLLHVAAPRPGLAPLFPELLARAATSLEVA